MAFTKAPTQDTHNTTRITPQCDAFVTSNYLQELEPVTCNYMDCFPLTEKMFQDNERVTVQRREGWKKAAAASGTVDTTGILGKTLVPAPDSAYTNVFFAKKSSYYMFNYSTKAVTSVTTSTTASAAQYAAGCDAIDSSNARRICFLDTANELKTWLQDGTSVTTTSLAGISVLGTCGLVFIDGYLFAVDSTGTKIHNSGAANALTTWNSTDYIDAEMYGDPIVHIAKHRNYLVAFGSASIEFFYDAGIEVGSPLARQESYARQIGLVRTSDSGRNSCAIDDDLYFIGSRANDTLSLFRIRNFQVEEVGNQYLQNVLNYISTDPAVPAIDGVETIIVNNNPMVLINLDSTNYAICYFPKEDTWWMMRQGDPSLVDFPTSDLRFGKMFYTPSEGIPMFLGQLASNSATLYYWMPDYAHTQSLTCQIYTPIQDMGNNRWKHFARVDAIGDYGQNNTLTLKFIPGATYQASPITVTPSRSPGLSESTQPISFYNIGGYRRLAFLLQIAGYDHWVYEGLEIEYNVGIA